MITICNPPPRIAVFALGVLLSLALCLIPITRQAESLMATQRADYGQALADAAARESVEAAFRQDLLSLRVIAQAIVNNPDVTRATIHNVEGRLLVQAENNVQVDTDSRHTYQATVALQDSVAGVITVSIKPKTWHQPIFDGLYTVLALACVFIITWQCYVAKVFVFKPLKTNRPKKDADPLHLDKRNEETNTLEASATQANSAQPPEDALPFFNERPSSDDQDILPGTDSQSVDEERKSEHAYAALCVKNVATLQQQLNGEVFRRTFTLLELKLNHIAQLYGGQQCHWEHDRYLIRFSAHQQEDALFHATCAAGLMLDVAGITNRIPLDLAAQISADEAHASTDKMPFVGLALQQSGGAFERLSAKVKLMELEEGEEPRHLVTAFFSPYQELLKNQLAQIQTQLDESGPY